MGNDENRQNEEKTGFFVLFRKVQKKYPYNPAKQMEYFRCKQQNRKYELLATLRITRSVLNLNGRHIEVEREDLDRMFRSLIDLTAHLKENLPDGVYDYNLNYLKELSDRIVGPACRSERDAVLYEESLMI